MCGFAACVSLDGKPPEHSVARMLPTLTHRGPDDSGTWHRGNAAIGFRRLSIIDLTSGGHQPMVSDDGLECLAFNGEIYNYLELRRDLESSGYRFRSASDTEVLLKAYQHWGAACVSRFIGMWAFVIVDVRRGILFGSRDRFGVKPLFLARSPRRVLLASEIKGLLAAMEPKPRIDWNTAAAFLMEGRLDETTGTFFHGIESIPAAHSFSVDLQTGAMSMERYWEVPRDVQPVADAPQEFAALFDDAIRLHARSDVPIAVHLSGGLDSTSILAGLAAIQSGGLSGELNAVCFMDPDFDEMEQITATVAATGARLDVLSMSAEQIWSRLPGLLRAHDEPAHTMTALVSYCLMERTHELGVKVVLNGQGADETLAGYPSYFRAYWRELLMQGNVAALSAQVKTYASVYGGRASALMGRELKACAQYVLGFSSMYRAAAEAARRPRRDGWFSRDFTSRYHDPTRLPASMGLHEDLRRSMATAPLPIYLRVEDRNSMAHSIESRVPFLDHRLVEFALRLPSPELLDGYWNKHLLRRAMTGRIPEVVRTRWRKFGFPTPAHRWLRGPLVGHVRYVLDELLAKSSDVFCEPAIRSDFDRFVAGDIECSEKLFRVVQFLLWRESVSIT